MADNFYCVAPRTEEKSLKFQICQLLALSPQFIPSDFKTVFFPRSLPLSLQQFSLYLPLTVQSFPSRFPTQMLGMPWPISSSGSSVIRKELWKLILETWMENNLVTCDIDSVFGHIRDKHILQHSFLCYWMEEMVELPMRHWRFYGKDTCFENRQRGAWNLVVNH